MPDKSGDTKAPSDPGKIDTQTVKKAPPSPETKKVADPGLIRTVRLREAARPPHRD